jgi:hypothetical protein
MPSDIVNVTISRSLCDVKLPQVTFGKNPSHSHSDGGVLQLHDFNKGDISIVEKMGTFLLWYDKRLLDR